MFAFAVNALGVFGSVCQAVSASEPASSRTSSLKIGAGAVDVDLAEP